MEEHSQLAGHLSQDNQKLLRLFEEKQERLQALSERCERERLVFLDESRAYQQWLLTNLQQRGT